jgi:hypothetical protein
VKKTLNSLRRLVFRKPEGKRSLGSRRRGRENNIKMVLQDIGCGLDLISCV